MKRQTQLQNEITVTMPMTRDCVGDIRNIIVLARRSVVRHVNTTMTLAYWLIGRRIVVEEQNGKRATYGERLLERISRELGTEFGNGFGEPHLRNCRLFYKAYPTEPEIRCALRIKLTWTHHRAIMRVHEPKARAFYLKEAVEQGWDTRELERQIRMFAYERVVANQVEIADTTHESQELTPGHRADGRLSANVRRAEASGGRCADYRHTSRHGNRRAGSQVFGHGGMRTPFRHKAHAVSSDKGGA